MKIRNKFPVPIALLVSSFTSITASGSDVYDIEGFISAEFGGRPILAGEIGTGLTKTKSYQYFDEENIIVYALTFDVNRRPPAPVSEIPLLLKEYASSQASALASSLLHYRTKNIGNQKVAFYTIKYSMQGLIWKKVSLTSIVDGRNISWSIQTADEHSSLDAETVFDSGYGKLRVCGHSLYSTKLPICDPE